MLLRLLIVLLVAAIFFTSIVLYSLLQKPIPNLYIELSKTDGVCEVPNIQNNSSIAYIAHDLHLNNCIASFTMRYTLPNSLKIEIEEKQPYAFWQEEESTSHGFIFIDNEGTIVCKIGDISNFVHIEKCSNNNNNTKLKNINILAVYGKEANIYFPKLLLALHKAAIYDILEKVILEDNKSWTLQTKKGVEIHLPKSNISNALDYAAGYKDYDAINALDLRLYPKQIYFRKKNVKNKK